MSEDDRYSTVDDENMILFSLFIKRPWHAEQNITMCLTRDYVLRDPLGAKDTVIDGLEKALLRSIQEVSK